MTEKQYKLEQWTSSSLYYSFPNGNLHHSIGEVIARVENDLNNLYNENKQLKQQLSEQASQIDFLKDENKHMRNVLNENKKLKQTIREAYENERTQLGKSVLKQLMEAIQ